MATRSSKAPLPEVSIGPHPAREDWRVLRVSYPADYEHALKIGDAIGVLLGRPSRRSIGTVDHQPATVGSRS